jgi:homeobox-leucine zipper protein
VRVFFGLKSQADFLDSHHLQQAFEQQLFEQIPAAAVDSSDNIIHGRSDALVDEFESKSCSENPDGTASGDDGQGDEDPNQRPNKKKRYHRHTQHQIEEMEA